MRHSFTLPFPPSNWKLHVRNRRGGKTRSNEYQKWLREAGTELMVQRPVKWEEPVKVSMDVFWPDNRLRDIDNLIKPCLDLLVTHQVIQDDNRHWLKGISINEAQSDPKGFRSGVRVRVEAA